MDRRPASMPASVSPRSPAFTQSGAGDPSNRGGRRGCAFPQFHANPTSPAYQSPARVNCYAQSSPEPAFTSRARWLQRCARGFRETNRLRIDSAGR